MRQHYDFRLGFVEFDEQFYIEREINTMFLYSREVHVSVTEMLHYKLA